MSYTREVLLHLTDDAKYFINFSFPDFFCQSGSQNLSVLLFSGVKNIKYYLNKTIRNFIFGLQVSPARKSWKKFLLERYPKFTEVPYLLS